MTAERFLRCLVNVLYVLGGLGLAVCLARHEFVGLVVIGGLLYVLPIAFGLTTPTRVGVERE